MSNTLTQTHKDAITSAHGGKLFSAIHELEPQGNAQNITLDASSVCDLICIASGIYSPLTGFINEKEYNSILNHGRLLSGLAWTIPICLIVDDTSSRKDEANLYDQSGLFLGQIQISDVFSPDKTIECESIYQTTDTAHPGVASLMSKGNTYLAGQVKMSQDAFTQLLPNHNITPLQVRKILQEKGFNSVVGFQTRNPIHRAHEYITKVALETCDALFINPLIGHTKSDDIPAAIRVDCYNTLIENYYPKDRVIFGSYPAAMRYAGPKEAVLHAISRKNYGCSHFIVGRDHAGVGSYYGTYDAQKIFQDYSQEELDINILSFEHAFYCKKCESLASTKTCPHDSSFHVHLSGTQVRSMLDNGQRPPAEFSRPEIADILLKAYSN